jgi:hypothetical protein
MEEFEQELRQAFVRRPAPPSLKRKLMARRADQRHTRHRQNHIQLWQRLAASLVLVALLGGAAEWDRHDREERRQGEAARQQVLTALRITGHALDRMNTQLAAHDRTEQR